MSQSKWTNKEYLITAGYGLLVLAAYFAADCLGFLGPFWWIFGSAVGAFIAAIPYLYINAREQRYGTVTILGFIALLYGLIGGSLSNVPYLICTLVALIIPDLIRAWKGYDSFSGMVLSFIVFALGHTGAQLNVWLKPEWCRAQAAAEMSAMDPTYADRLVDGFGSGGYFILFILAVIVCSSLGMLFAKKLLKKTCDKYGVNH